MEKYVAEEKNGSTQKVKYRSRFVLWLVAWVTAFAGGHLNWLGFKEAGEAWRAEHGVIKAVFTPVCWIFHCWEQIAIIFGKYKTDAYGNPVKYFAFIRNLKNK